jgi:hypothetical protein
LWPLRFGAGRGLATRRLRPLPSVGRLLFARLLKKLTLALQRRSVGFELRDSLLECGLGGECSSPPILALGVELDDASLDLAQVQREAPLRSRSLVVRLAFHARA